MLKTESSIKIHDFVKEKNLDINNPRPSSSLGFFYDSFALEILKNNPLGLVKLLKADVVDVKKETHEKNLLMFFVEQLVLPYDNLSRNNILVLHSLIKKTGIDHQISKGETALMHALDRVREPTSYRVLDILLSYEPDLSLTTNDGRLAQSFAKNNHLFDLRYFEENEASLTKKMLLDNLKNEKEINQDKAKKKRM